VSGVDERETPHDSEPPLEGAPFTGQRPPAVRSDPGTELDGASSGTGWPTTPAEIPLDGRSDRSQAAGSDLAGSVVEPTPHPHRHSRNPVDRLTRGLPDPVRIVVDWLVTIIGAVAIVLLVKAYVVNPYRIPSSSMEPTLHCAQPASGCEARFSDRVLANRFIYHLRDPRRGEIVVFDTPDAARVKCGAGGTLKRLVGMPGDTVEVRLDRGEGYVFINGKKLDEPYLEQGRRATEEFGPVTVEDSYFMMRTRSQSCDSREWGSVLRQPDRGLRDVLAPTDRSGSARIATTVSGVPGTSGWRRRSALPSGRPGARVRGRTKSTPAGSIGRIGALQGRRATRRPARRRHARASRPSRPRPAPPPGQDLLRAARRRDQALARIGAVSRRLTLAAAQLTVARDYGFGSWPKLRTEVERRQILDSRDLARLDDLLADDSALATARMEHWRDHPKGASPLGYVAMLRYDTSRGAWRDLPGTGAIARALLAAGAPVDGDPGESETPLITAPARRAEVVRLDRGGRGSRRQSRSRRQVSGGTAMLHAACSA
jgi:signal peptidase I